MRQSSQSTYDSRETGPRYHVTSRINDQTIDFQRRIEDPFVRQAVRVGWRDLLRALFTRHELVVEVIVGSDPQVVEDVLDLDANHLGLGDSTRRREFNAGIVDTIDRVLADPATLED